MTDEDWEHHRKYDEYLLAVEEMLERTETEWGPWTIVEATNRWWARVKIFNTIIDALATRLDAAGVTTEVIAGEDDDYVEEAELAAESEGTPQEPTEETPEA